MDTEKNLRGVSDGMGSVENAERVPGSSIVELDAGVVASGCVGKHTLEIKEVNAGLPIGTPTPPRIHSEPSGEVKEAEIARHFGITRETLRGYRDELLLKGTDWRIYKKVPVWTPGALEAVSRHIQGASAPVVLEALKTEKVRLTHPTQNPTIWFADLDGKRVSVRVKPDDRWWAGIWIDVREGGHPGVYVYEGPVPRWKGKL